MAKNRHPLMRLQGTIGGITFVTSQAYKDHIRSPRGTKKEARLNETFEKNSKATEPINLKAKVVHDELKVISGKFKQGSLWSRLLSRLRTAQSMSVCELVSSLEGVEINERYKLESVCKIPTVSVLKKGKKVEVNIHFRSYLRFDHEVQPDSYHCDFTILWIDKQMKRCEVDRLQTEWIAIDINEFRRSTSFDIPGWVAFYVVVLKIQGGSKGRAIENFFAEGIRIIQAASLNKLKP